MYEEHLGLKPPAEVQHVAGLPLVVGGGTAGTSSAIIYTKKYDRSFKMKRLEILFSSFMALK